jgi:outer membrane protein
MKKRRLHNLLLFTLLCFSLPGLAQKKNEFSLKQCTDYAAKNSETVKNALLDVEIQKQFNRQVTSSAYPQIGATISTTNYIDIPTSLIPGEIFNQPGTVIPVQFGTKFNATGTVEVNQLLFDGQVFVGLMARKAIVDYQTKVSDVTLEQIRTNIYKIYYQLVVGKKQMAALDANIERFEKLLNDTREIFKNGFAEKLDVDKVIVQLNNIRTEKTKMENALAAGNAGLKFLMNMPQKEELVLTDTLNEEELKSNILDEQYSYKDRKEMQLLNIAEKLGGYNVRRYQLSKIPTLAAFGQYSKNAQRPQFNFFGSGDWFTTSYYGLKISIPLFDGNNRNAHIQQAKYELQKTRNSMEQLKQNIDYDVQNSRISMKSALVTLDNQKKNIDLAEKVYNSTKKKYEQGLGSNQEIYSAETELKVAQSNYYGALYDAINARIDYLKATGKL